MLISVVNYEIIGDSCTRTVNGLLTRISVMPNAMENTLGNIIARTVAIIALIGKTLVVTTSTFVTKETIGRTVTGFMTMIAVITNKTGNISENIIASTLVTIATIGTSQNLRRSQRRSQFPPRGSQRRSQRGDLLKNLQDSHLRQLDNHLTLLGDQHPHRGDQR